MESADGTHTRCVVSAEHYDIKVGAWTWFSFFINKNVQQLQIAPIYIVPRIIFFLWKCMNVV